MGNCPNIYENIDYAVEMIVLTFCPENNIINNINSVNHNIIPNNIPPKPINYDTKKLHDIINNNIIEEKLDILIHNFTPRNDTTEYNFEDDFEFIDKV